MLTDKKLTNSFIIIIFELKLYYNYFLIVQTLFAQFLILIKRVFVFLSFMYLFLIITVIGH